MAARNALLGMVLSAIAVNAMARSPIPVVSAGVGTPVSGTTASVVTTTAAPSSQSVAEPIVLLNQLDTLQREVMELRGLVEEQANIIDRIQKENRDRYLDLDRRMSQLSSGKSAVKSESHTAVKPAGPHSNSAASAMTFGQKPVDTVAVDGAGEALYQETFQLIRDRKFPEALAGLNKYISTYPSGPYVDNAQYWLGEVQLAQGDLKQAEADFTLLVQKYPFSDKLSDAIYKLGQVYDRLGERDKAREYLQRAIKDFPESSAARLADVYLRSLDG